MNQLFSCDACSRCAVVQPCGFASRAYLWCRDMSREVTRDDGCTMGDHDGARVGIEGRCDVTLPGDHNRREW